MVIREAAGSALGAVLQITARRENRQSGKPVFYKQCFEGVEQGLDLGLSKKSLVEDSVHGSLLILLQLLRTCNSKLEEVFAKEEALLAKSPNRPRSNYVRDASMLDGENSRNAYQTSFGNQSDDRSKGGAEESCDSMFIEEMMNEKYSKLCSLALKTTGSKSPFIHSTLLAVIPRLAAFNPSTFLTNSLGEVLEYLRKISKQKDNKSASFISLGLLAVAVGSKISRRKDIIFPHLKAALQSKEKKHKIQTYEPALFSCVTMLSLALKENKAINLNEIKAFVDDLFNLGLSSSLVRSMESLCCVDNELKMHIQSSLIRLLHFVLIGRPMQHPSVNQGQSAVQIHPSLSTSSSSSMLPNFLSQFSASSYGSSSSILNTASPMSAVQRSGGHSRPSISGASEPIEVLTLALRTLRTFNFEGDFGAC